MINQDKKLLITGGTGSFGYTVLNRFLKDNSFSEIRVFSRDEKKQDDMRKTLNNPKIKFYIGDVRDLRSVEDAVKGVDYIYHAAALKQVPSCEFFPIEAVKTNILGTDNVLYAAEKFEVKKVVVLSTDKAAYPINAMGMSKALMEKVMVARSRNLDPRKTTFCATRYGNVMASRGSVIPLFIDQIKSKNPLTITDPNMTRFIMSLDEAVDLVLYAFENAEPGDIFIQKAPSATIGILAKSLLKIYGAKNKINIIGTRHGEKQYETLINKEDMAKAISIDNYYKIPSDNRDLNYESYFSNGDSKFNIINEYNSNNTKILSEDELIERLLTLDIVKKDLKVNII